MARRIKFKTKCFYCEQWFEKGEAYLQRVKDKWFCQCDECHEKRLQEQVKNGARE